MKQLNNRIYSTKEVVGITGETVQRLHYWDQKRLYSPYDPSAGTGTSRKFSYQNLVEIITIQSITGYKLDINIIRKVVEMIHKERPDYFKESLEETMKSKRNFLVLRISSPKAVIMNLMSSQDIIKYCSDLSESTLSLLQINLIEIKRFLEERLKELGLA